MIEASKADQRLGRLRYWLLAAAILAYVVIITGSIVRVTGSGLACPDWPTCNGSWLPPLRFDGLIVFAHRTATLLLAPVVMVAVSITLRRFGHMKLLYWPTLLALPLLAVQSVIGAYVVDAELASPLVAFHLGVSLVILAMLVMACVTAFVRYYDPAQAVRLKFRSPFAHLTLLSTCLIFIVLVTGALVASSNSAMACQGWPWCGKQLIPSNLPGWINLIHRTSVVLATASMLALLVHAWRSQRSQRAILPAATLTVVLFIAQILVGALQTTQGYPTYLLGLHVTTASAVWTSSVILLVFVGLAARSPEAEAREKSQPVDGKQRMRDLLSLTKPIIVVLLLITTYAGMVVGGRAIPSAELTFWVLLAGALAAGGSGAVNQYIDRELDQRMTRTAKRPIAAGRMTAAEGLAFGLALLFISFYLFAGFVNLLAALLSLTGMLYYVLLYSLWLKHANEQNIVIGGGAGAIPPLVGWAATTGSISIAALFLFGIIFMWTPPHFWALALVREKDYARAGIPMMPVIRGEKETRWQIFLYSLELVGLTLLMFFLGMAGLFYLVSAAILGLWLLTIAWKVWREGGNKLAWRMYRHSSMYLAFLFVALMVDALV